MRRQCIRQTETLSLQRGEGFALSDVFRAIYFGVDSQTERAAEGGPEWELFVNPLPYAGIIRIRCKGLPTQVLGRLSAETPLAN